MSNSDTPRRPRRRWRWLAAIPAIAVVLVAAFPWLLSTPPGRRRLVAWANRSIAPSRIELASVRFSWFGPTRATGFAIVDGRGDRVVTAPRGTWDRSLWQLLFDQPRHGTMRMERAVVDVAHRADGTISLAEALKPIFRPDPAASIKILIPDGRLRVRSARMPEAIEAGHADLTIETVPSPGPVTLRLRLVRDPAAATPETLDLRGRFAIWTAPKGVPSDVEIDVAGQRWPWSFRGGELTSRGRLDGSIALRRRSGQWSSSGDARIEGLDVAGTLLAGDHLRVADATGRWDVEEAGASWRVRRLDVESPILTLRADGVVPDPSESPATAEGTVDLAALARQLPHALHLREGVTLDRGTARLRIEGRTDGPEQAWRVEAKLADLAGRRGGRAFALRDPADLSASLSRGRGRLRLETLRVRSAFLNGSAKGDLDRGIDGTFSVDLAGFRRQFRDLIDFGDAELAGTGELRGRYSRAGAEFRAHVDGELRDLRVDAGAAGSLARDRAVVAFDANGPTSESGLPGGWRALKASLTAGELRAQLAASSAPGDSGLDLSARLPLRSGGREREASADLRLHWGDQVVAIERARLGLNEGGNDAGRELVRLEARGHFDRERGELVLQPAEGGPARGVLALGPEGVRVAGLGGRGTLQGEGTLVGDLGAAGRLLGDPALDLDGSVSAHLGVGPADGGLRFDARLRATDVSWAADGGRSRVAEAPVELAVAAFRQSGSDQLDVTRLALSTRYGTLQAWGRLTELTGRRKVDLRGKLSPDWQTINSELARRLDPSVRVAGRPRPLRLSGELPGWSPDAWRSSVAGDFGFDAFEASFFGAQAGPATVVARADNGGFDFEPIDTTLNGGKLHLEPDLRLASGGGLTLRLGPNSTLEDAEINDEISRRVLAFVAPVLQDATRARGRVSFDLKEAVFPLGGGPADRSTKVEGEVLFEGVEFVPGPTVDELFDLVRIERRPRIRLNRPVALRIADRRVYQQGLAVPLGDVTQIEMEGWVGFDGELAMTASLPVTPAMFGNNPVLGTIVEGTRISVPIRGTLQKPKIDGKAMGLALRDLGKTLLDRGVGAGASELLNRLIRPRDPDAPPPLSRDERRQRRMERKAQRRMERGLEP